MSSDDFTALDIPRNDLATFEDDLEPVLPSLSLPIDLQISDKWLMGQQLDQSRNWVFVPSIFLEVELFQTALVMAGVEDFDEVVWWQVLEEYFCDLPITL